MTSHIHERDLYDDILVRVRAHFTAQLYSIYYSILISKYVSKSGSPPQRKENTAITILSGSRSSKPLSRR